MASKKAAVIGNPVKHSLSPKLHNYWLNKYNIDAEYGMLEVSKEKFFSTVRGLHEDGYVGVNITVPYKEMAFDICDEISDAAKHTGAVNTISFGDRGRIIGTNTDPYGFLRNLVSSQPEFYFRAGVAVVIGAGGAARAVISALALEKSTDVIIINRTQEKAIKIKNDFEGIGSGRIIVADWEDRNNIIAEANLLVNTTVLGMQGQDPLDINLDKLPASAMVNDIVYRPLQTDLLKNASDRGNMVVDGLGMLLYQAQLSFKVWFDMEPEVTEELRKYILD